MALSIRDALLPDGTRTSVRMEGGVVAAVGAPSEPGDDVIDAEGRLLLPAMTEPHAHLDKAFLAEVIPNPTGDLMGACEGMETHRHLISPADTEARAERAARLIAANGATVIRTHADVTAENGMQSVDALVAVRERLKDLVTIQVVALSGWPSTTGEQQALLREAIRRGVDGIGGCPHLEDDPHGATDLFIELAGEHGIPLDLHTDETTDPSRFALPYLAERVLATGFAYGVTASHCVSLGMQPVAEQQRVAELLAAADISVVVLPSSNLYLQGRDQQQAMPRALTAIAALRSAGVNVAAGADNLQDPFNLVGRGDCLETAALMVMAGHQLPDDAYHAVSTASRRALGLRPAAVEVGAVADFVLIRAASTREAIAFAPADRIVVRTGAATKQSVHTTRHQR